MTAVEPLNVTVGATFLHAEDDVAPMHGGGDAISALSREDTAA